MQGGERPADQRVISLLPDCAPTPYCKKCVRSHGLYKVDAKGNVIAKKKGTAVIKAVVTLKNGKKKTLEIKYKVK